MSAFTLLCGQSRGQPHPPSPPAAGEVQWVWGQCQHRYFHMDEPTEPQDRTASWALSFPKDRGPLSPWGVGRGGDMATGGTRVTPNHSPSHFTMLPPPRWVRRSAPGTEEECRKCLFNAPTDQTTDLSSRADLGDISRSFLKQFYDNNLSFFLFLFS